MKTLRKWIMPLLVAAVLGSFVWGTTRLLLLRFERGDVYPPYSTLRADPLGAKAFYESLDECRGISVERNYQPLDKVEGGPDKALFVLGASPGEVSFSLTRDLDAFVRRGGRLVVTFIPMAEDSFEIRKKKLKERKEKAPEKADDKEEEEETPKNEEAKKEEVKRDEAPGNEAEKKDATPADPKKDAAEPDKEKSARDRNPIWRDDEDNDNRYLFAPEAWGFEFKHNKLPDPGQGTKAKLKESPLNVRLPKSVSCHTSLYFDKLDGSWRVLYERSGGRALVIERRLNKGTLVLSALTYFISNEAMKQERHPELLGWLAGDKKRIIFDEFHNDVTEMPGVATLGRKYRLHGLFAGLLLLAILFVWKSAAGFVPSREDGEGGSALAKGKDSAAGLVNLLRRNIPLRGVIRMCLDEWKKSFAHGRTDLHEKIGRMETVVAGDERDPLYAANLEKTYNKLCEILAERK